MRKLQYVFMTLAVLFMATPAFAQTGAAAARQPGSDRRRNRHGHRRRPLRPRTGQGNRVQPLKPSPATPEPAPASSFCWCSAWPYRVAHALHAGHHHPQGEVSFRYLKRKASGVPEAFLLQS